MSSSRSTTNSAFRYLPVRDNHFLRPSATVEARRTMSYDGEDRAEKETDDDRSSVSSLSCEDDEEDFVDESMMRTRNQSVVTPPTGRPLPSGGGGRPPPGPPSSSSFFSLRTPPPSPSLRTPPPRRGRPPLSAIPSREFRRRRTVSDPHLFPHSSASPRTRHRRVASSDDRRIDGPDPATAVVAERPPTARPRHRRVVSDHSSDSSFSRAIVFPMVGYCSEDHELAPTTTATAVSVTASPPVAKRKSFVRREVRHVLNRLRSSSRPKVRLRRSESGCLT